MKLGSTPITGKDKVAIMNELVSPQPLTEEQKETYSSIKSALKDKKTIKSD